MPKVVRGSVCNNEAGCEAKSSDKKEEPLLHDDTKINLELTTPGTSCFLLIPFLKSKHVGTDIFMSWPHFSSPPVLPTLHARDW